MVGGKNPKPREGFELWERELVKTIAARIRTTDRDDLESVLAIHLWELKKRFASAARSWKAFARTALRNKAANWIRDRQLAEKRATSLEKLTEDGADEGPTLTGLLIFQEADIPTQAALSRVWDDLDEGLKRVWALLLEEDGNQARVARRLGKHRNTVRLRIRQIREFLEQHGFEGRR